MLFIPKEHQQLPQLLLYLLLLLLVRADSRCLPGQLTAALEAADCRAQARYASIKLEHVSTSCIQIRQHMHTDNKTDEHHKQQGSSTDEPIGAHLLLSWEAL